MSGFNERRRAVVLATITVLGILVAGVGPIGAVAGGDDPVSSSDVSNDADAVQTQEGGTLSGEINLTDAEVTMRGDEPDDRFGAAIAPATDVNGDGDNDVLVGAQFANATANRSGAAYLFHGPVEDGEYDAADADLTLRGESQGDWAGYSVASGDVNGDGLSDLIVGAPLEDEAGSNAGAVYVIYGAEDLKGTVNLSDADVKLVGGEAGDQFGLSVAAVDTDADGTDAVVAGAPRNDAAGLGAGAAYVFEIDGDVMLSAADADATYYGESAGDRTGWSVANAGDANDDGEADVLIGAPLNNSTAPNAGAAYLVTDATGEAPLSAATKMTGEGEGDLAGWAVSDAGDVNNDSVGDVIIGAPRNDTTGTNAGSAYVVHGSDSLPDGIGLADADRRLRGEEADDRAGYAVSSAGSGDVTCDEIDDVLVGAPKADASGNNSGTAYLVYGSDDSAENRSLATAEAKLHGEGPGDRAGVAVSDVNDISGDGNEDVAVGAPRNDTVGENNGAAYVVNGQCPVEEEPETTEEPTDTTTEDTTTEDTTTERTTKEPEDQLDGVDISTQCVDGQGEITVTNPNDEAVLINAYRGAAYSKQATLHPGESVTLDTLGDGTYTVETIDTDSHAIIEIQNVVIDCPDDEKELEGVDIEKQCVDGDVQITVTNPNDETVYVYEDGTSVPGSKFSLGPGESVTFGDDPSEPHGDGEYTYTTYADSKHTDRIDSETFTIECEEDEKELEGVDISTQCVDGEGEMTITNPNDEKVIVDVYIAAVYDEQRTLDPGETVTLSGLDNGSYAVETIDADSREIVDLENVQIHCPDDEKELEGVDIEKRCVDGQGEITITNPNDQEVDIRVTAEDGTVVETATVEPGNAYTVGLNGLDDGNYTIETIVDGEVIDTTTVEIDCPDEEEPEGVNISQDCVSEDGEIIVENTNYETNVTVDITGPDGYSDSVELEPGETATFENLDDGNYTVNTTADGELIASETVEIDCDEERPPGVIVDETKCLDDGGAIVLENRAEGAVPVTVTISNQSLGYEQTEELGAGSGTTVGGLEDAVYTVETVVDGEVVATETVEIDCQDEEEPRGSQDATAVADECEQLTVTNPSENDGNVDFRIRNSNGVVTTVDDVAPGDSVTEDLSAEDYTVDARYVTDDSFGSGNVTVNGQDEATISVDACDQPGAVCEGQAKYNVGSGVSVDSDVGNDFDNVSVNGDVDGVTVTNDEAFAVDVYVKAASDQAGGATFGPIAVEAGNSMTIDTSDTNGFQLSAIGIVCEGAGTPGFPPFTLPDNGDGDQRLRGEVTDTNGQGIENAQVEIIDTSDGSTVETLTTDSNGEFGPVGVPPGSYEATASKQGYTFASSTTVQLEAGETENINVLLEEESQQDQPPTASISGPSELEVNEDGSFSAGGSSDDGSIQSYDWDFDDGDTETGESLSHSYASDGTYTVTLTVTDDDGNTDTDTQDVTVQTASQPANFAVTVDSTNAPVSEGDTLEVTATIENTGDEQKTQTIELQDFDDNLVDSTDVTLDGGESQSITLEWQTESGDAGSGDVTVVSADDSDRTGVVIKGTNQPPTADAGSGLTVGAEDSVSLDASGSTDPDGDALSYEWTQTGGESVSLSDTTSVSPSFDAPDSETTLTFEVAVSDGNGSTDTNSVSVTVDPSTTDTDGDSVANSNDNCPQTANPKQTGTDGDGTGDACGQDKDGDRVPNSEHASPVSPSQQSIALPDEVVP